MSYVIKNECCMLTMEFAGVHQSIRNCTIFRAILLCCFLMDNGYNIETCKIIGATSLRLHFLPYARFFAVQRRAGAWPKWPNGKYATDCQRCISSAGTLISGDIRFVQIFGRVL